MYMFVLFQHFAGFICIAHLMLSSSLFFTRTCEDNTSAVVYHVELALFSSRARAFVLADAAM